MEDQSNQFTQPTKPNQPGVAKLRRLIADEFGALRPRILIAEAIQTCLPRYTAERMRTMLWRMAGLQIGSGTLLWGSIRISGSGDIARKLRIGAMSGINFGCFFDLNDQITIGDHIGIGHEVMFLTASHQIGPAWRRFGPLTSAPVQVEDGAWIGARSLILPGVTIGRGSVVAAGSVVNRSVAPNTLVGGVPARPIRELDRQ